LKSDDVRAATLSEARRIRDARAAGEGGLPTAAPEVIRALAAAAARPLPTKVRPAKAPKKTGSGEVVVRNGAGTPLIRVDGKDRRGVTLTIFHKGGGTRAEAEDALREILDYHWPA
jgi:ParB family chromosome partitioning protein